MKKLFLLVLGLISLNAYADPTYDATRGALQNNSALCGYGYNPNCSSGNTPPPKKNHLLRRQGAFQIRGSSYEHENWLWGWCTE